MALVQKLAEAFVVTCTIPCWLDFSPVSSLTRRALIQEQSYEYQPSQRLLGPLFWLSPPSHPDRHGHDLLLLANLSHCRDTQYALVGSGIRKRRFHLLLSCMCRAALLFRAATRNRDLVPASVESHCPSRFGSISLLVSHLFIFLPSYSSRFSSPCYSEKIVDHPVDHFNI